MAIKIKLQEALYNDPLDSNHNGIVQYYHLIKNDETIGCIRFEITPYALLVHPGLDVVTADNLKQLKYYTHKIGKGIAKKYDYESALVVTDNARLAHFLTDKDLKVLGKYKDVYTIYEYKVE